jgi:transcriptional regulator with GAF, ATPase, and Fis domain
MRQLLESLERVARADAPVLILGESGTGKELVAREIHHLGPGNERPFVTVNCAVLQTNILESELFGHEKGAFTGAAKRRLGLFEIADGGSMFLDEIGEIDESIQAKLLRVLQFGEFRRVGGNDTLTTRVRIIAATNKDLEAAAQESRFRQDLFFRLNVVHLTVPPLRDRAEDLPILAEHFLALFCERHGKPPTGFSIEALKLLARYPWPGNVRELACEIERVVVLTPPGETVRDEHLSPRLLAAAAPPADDDPLGRARRQAERRLVLAVLDNTDWNVAAAARELRLSRVGLTKMLKRLGLARPETQRRELVGAARSESF